MKSQKNHNKNSAPAAKTNRQVHKMLFKKIIYVCKVNGETGCTRQ